MKRIFKQLNVNTHFVDWGDRFFALATIMGMASIVAVLLMLVLAQPAQALIYNIPDILTPAETVALEADADVPRPFDLDVVQNTPRTITVVWGSDMRFMAAEVSDVAATSTNLSHEYLVNVFEKQSGRQVAAISTSRAPLTLKNLQKNRAYLIKIVSVRNGKHSAATELVARTTPASPQKSTFEVKSIKTAVNTTSAASVRLSWDKVGGTIRYYVVNVYQSGQDKVIKTIKSSDSQVLVQGLKRGKYEFDVTAYFNDNYYSTPAARQSFMVR